MHRSLLLMLFLTSSALAQTAEREQDTQNKLHQYLRGKMEEASAGDKLPVYFVMRDKVDTADLYQRVRRMDKQTRRATVVGELAENMQRTQRDLFDSLRADAAQGKVEIVSRNYLGNFIRVRATPDVIAARAALPSVAEVWYDYEPPLALVEDSAPVAPAPGNGPLDTRSFEVWANGITGKGVVWMNSDSGCRVSQSVVGDIHPGLAGKLWENPGEIFNNGVDDDGNGKVDDFFGWDFGFNDNTIDDGGGHGTSVTGVFVAVRHDNGDILGNCPDARIMIGKLAGEASQWDSIQYAIDMKAHGQTSSHSYKNNFNPPPNYKMHRDVGEKSLAAGLIRTNSTSNNGSQCNNPNSQVRRPFNISAPGCLPPPWLHPDQTLVGRIGGCMGIGAHNVGTSQQPSFTPCGPFAWSLDDLLIVRPDYPLANWDTNDNDYPWKGGIQLGLLKPDMTGPAGTLTSSGSSSYTNFGGTSNATPSVSSCLALALSANDSLTPEDMSMAAQVSAVDEGPAGKDNSWGAGRVDAWELTKLARAIHRVNGDVSHTVKVSILTSRWSLELDSIPNTTVVLLMGTIPTEERFGEFILRIKDAKKVLSGKTDNNGNFRVQLPIPPLISASGVLTQFAVADPLFGPRIGSNAVRTIFVPSIVATEL